MKANTTPEKSQVQLHVPPWVPRSVADYARTEWEGSHNFTINGQLLSDLFPQFLLRLTCDPRMRGVWRELSRRHRGGAFIHPAKIEGVTADERQSAAMMELFRRVWLSKLLPNVVVTRRAAEQNHRELMKKAKDLTDTAATLLARGLERGGKAATHSGRFLRPMDAVRVLEEYAGETRDFEMRTAVDRGRGEERARWFVLTIADAAKTLFGSPLYGLTATIASIAMEREIEPQTVRQWCATPPCG